MKPTSPMRSTAFFPTPTFARSKATTPAASRNKTSVSIVCAAATKISTRLSSKRKAGESPKHEPAAQSADDQAEGLHSRAQPALCRRTIRPGRLAPAPLAARSRRRRQLPRRRSAVAPRLRLGGTHSRPAHHSARAHLLLAPLARPQRCRRCPHLFRILLVVPARARARLVLRKTARLQEPDQLPQWRSPRPPPALPLGRVRSLSRR